MASTTLLDRMHREMCAEARAFTADELGRTYLKLLSPGPLTALLIRNLLEKDPRFEERSAGQWEARSTREPSLDQASYLLSWVEMLEEGRSARFRLHLHRWGNGIAEPLCPALLDTDLEGWGALREHADALRWATFQPALLGRVLQWMDRTIGWGELAQAPLDLLGWTRLELARGGMAVADARQLSAVGEAVTALGLGAERSAEGEAPADALGSILDALLERAGEWTESTLRSSLEETLGSRPVPWDRFAFRPSELDGVPDTPGIYRFFDREGTLIYVGKAARLARRVGSYFRPLPPERGKRDELLAEIHRFELEPLPTELEALLRESREIRTRKPRRNVQVAVHPLDTLPPASRWPLLFLPPGEDPLRATALLLESSEAGYLFHLPREGGETELEDLARWIESRLGRDPQEAARFAPQSLDLEEVRLALRFFLAQGDACDRVDSTALASPLAIAEALLDLAKGTGKSRLARPAGIA